MPASPASRQDIWGSLGTIGHGVLLYGLAAVVVVALADTPLYPLALAVVVIALLYVGVTGSLPQLGQGLLRFIGQSPAGTA